MNPIHLNADSAEELDPPSELEAEPSHARRSLLPSRLAVRVPAVLVALMGLLNV